MNGNRNIIEIIEEVVSKMTPFITVSSITANGDNWRLNTCNTYWITVDSQIIIDEVSYTVIDLVQNSYIEIESTTEPTVTEFQLEAPEFWHSSSRKVSNERSNKEGGDVRKPFVYLPVPRITEDKAVDSDKAYDADIRPIFLTNFNPQRDTIELQQTQIIEPLNAMANFFLYLIKEDIANFDDFDSVDRREWMNFGNETVWGNDKKIFKENLSGVELFSFSLPVLINENCGCESDKKICADSSIYTNNVFYSFAGSGGDLNVDIRYENGDQVGEKIDGVWTIPDPIPLICYPATITVNSNPFATVPSGDPLNIQIKYQTRSTNLKYGRAIFLSWRGLSKSWRARILNIFVNLSTTTANGSNERTCIIDTQSERTPKHKQPKKN